MSQSKLESFSKKMNGTVHKTFQGKNGLLYKFNAVMENGDEGGLNSTKSEPNWVIGNEYTYDKETNAQGYTNLKNFKKLDAVPFAGNSGGGNRNYTPYFEKPDYVKATDEQFAMDISLKYCSIKLQEDANSVITPSQQDDLRKGIVIWLSSFGDDIKEHYHIKNAMLSAIDNMRYLNITSAKLLMDGAATIYIKLKHARDGEQSIPETTI